MLDTGTSIKNSVHKSIVNLLCVSLTATSEHTLSILVNAQDIYHDGKEFKASQQNVTNINLHFY